MGRVGLTSPMFVRLGVAVLACLSLPALVQGVALFSESRGAAPHYAQAVVAANSPNPFGTIVDDDFGQSQTVASSQGFEGLRRDDFQKMMAVSVQLEPESAVDNEPAPLLPPPVRPAPPATMILPIGCEGLGGVSTHLQGLA